ncbi:MAG TPA: transposase [Blastocatellia bacterium]|nr:transposase [Blastocatellia bacterium]
MISYRFRLTPSKRIAATFEAWLDGCREIYNAGLQERRGAYKLTGKSPTYYDQQNQLPEIKTLRPDIAAINAQVLQSALRKLDRSFDNFFRRVKNGEKPGYPRFKGKAYFNSFTFPQMKDAFRIEGKYLRLSKIGKVKLIQHRPIGGKIKTCTIKREANKWYAVFAVEENQSRWFPRTGDAVGVDVGIENFATLSTGEVIENPKHLRQAEASIKQASRNLARKKRGSKNYAKTKAVLAKKHQQVANRRADFFHKTGLRLIKEFDAIVFEDLNIKGLVKNHYLAKSISDAAWGTFINTVTSKAAKAGRIVERVPAAFTSQDCSSCGHRVRKSLAVREHRCIACGFVAHRDHNAAINIRLRSNRVEGDSALRNKMIKGKPRDVASILTT